MKPNERRILSLAWFHSLHKMWVLGLFTLWVIGLALPAPGRAQSEEQLRLRVSKTFGYSSDFVSGNLMMQGIFTLSASGPASLQRVVFYLDDTILGEDREEPFRLQFNTDDYTLGFHTIYAVGYKVDGQELSSNQVRGEFVTSEQGWQYTTRIIGPLLGLFFAVMLLATGVPFLLRRGKTVHLPPGSPRNYGVSGGAICPRCQRPFTLRLFGLNLFFYRLERCPFCGRWGLVRRASPAELQAAEKAELETAQATVSSPGLTEEERLRKELDNTRYL